MIDLVKLGIFGGIFLFKILYSQHRNISLSFELILIHFELVFLFFLIFQLIDSLLIFLLECYVHFLKFLPFLVHHISRVTNLLLNVDSFLIKQSLQLSILYF